MAEYPTFVTPLRNRVINFVVNMRVIDRNHLTVDFDGVGYPDAIDGEYLRQRHRDRCFPGAARPVQENRSTRIQGRSKLFENGGVKNKMGEGTLHLRGVYLQSSDALVANLLRVALQRNRSRPGIMIHQ